MIVREYTHIHRMREKLCSILNNRNIYRLLFAFSTFAEYEDLRPPGYYDLLRNL